MRTWFPPTLTFFSLCCLLDAPSLGSPNGWRTDGSGRYPSANPVLEWSTTENVVWKTPLPDKGNSMPVLVGDKLFVTVEPDRLLCISAKDGKILWSQSSRMADTLDGEQKTKLEANVGKIDELKKELEEGDRKIRELARAIRSATDAEKGAKEQEREKLKQRSERIQEELAGAGGFAEPSTHDANGYASATSVSDGERVFGVYGTGVVAAYDLTGKRLWIKLHEQPVDQWGHSTSPLLVGGKLIVHIKNMMALDPGTGAILWKTETPKSWGTPAIGEVEKVDILVTSKGDIIRASDGAKLVSALFELPYGSPIIHEGVIYGIDEKGGIALQLPEKIEGDSIAVKKLWTNDPPKDRYYSSPMVLDGTLYAMNRGQRLATIDAATGEILHSDRVDLGKGQQLYGSFALAGGHLFVSYDNGQTAVLKPGRPPQVVRTNPLEASRATPIFDGDRIYFRTDGHLFCLGRS